ncbi:phage tail protein [Mucilaginibacter jinjuensis]|uniref:Tail fiber protein n=1 Tax=Mucilaginibacter jinjuensis TaxID=1176721 RepID=A0ABY7TC29_9SPHI|nr:tail fiber protein [Mucilaginibacter jinjuensis]WCT14070.1 tail fiber protein [Mucilaginibacter jinjuensis]
MDAFVGEIRPYAFGFAPRGWMPCNGQILPIASYAPLFSILGTQYGGNGSTTFALPNIQSSVLNGSGTLLGGDTYTVGEMAGVSNVTLLSTEMPAHTHTVDGGTATSAISAVTVPTNSSYITNSFSKATPGATTGLSGKSYIPGTPPPTGLTNLNPTTIGISGGNLAHNNMAPYLAISYCICISGVFPTRN